jgi:hypothetical protein
VKTKILAGLALLAAPFASTVSAQDEPAPAVREGRYLFSTIAQSGPRPVCSESWEFLADGRMLVSSGQERVEKSWKLEEDRDGTWIVARIVSGNHAPDCMGNVTATYPSEEQRVYFVAFNDGFIQLCPPPGRTESGDPVIANCYARLVRAEHAG